MEDLDPVRIEEAGLNALQTQQQLFYDGWLLRLSPGKAKRGRSVNPHFGSSRPLESKIDHCEGVYAARSLPMLFRITPFVKPAALDATLEQRGYVAFDATHVQSTSLAGLPDEHGCREVEVAAATMAQFVDVVGALRASPGMQRDAHRERLAHTPLATHAVVARVDGRAVACGQVALDDGLAGIYDMVTSTELRGQGIGTRLIRALLCWARGQRATHAFLQVSADNAAALAVYRKFGFSTCYNYHYRGRSGECH